MFKKLLMFYFVSLLIFVGIQSLFHESTIPQPFTTVMETYNVNTSLSETEALELIEKTEISNVVEKDNFYILKTVDGDYYKIEKSDTIALGLELAGYQKDVPVEDSMTFLDIINILFIILGVVLIVRFIFFIRNSQKFIKNVENMAFFDSMNDEYPTGMASNSTKKESESDSSKIKKVTFNDVQGIDELKPDLYRLVDCLKNPKQYEELGARMPKGVILYGPPGTGKTLTAKAIAGEAGVPFFSMCGSDFMEKYVGVGASRVRDLYKKARKAAPCIVFIDEIDAIGGSRGQDSSGERDQTINALLAELDGFKSGENILTICATNRLDILDPALLRAGRFDLKLAIGLPDKDGRIAILKLHSKNKKLSEQVNIEDLAKKTIGFSGAELENLLNESALIAANENKAFIDNDDIENAFFKIIMDGNKKKRKEIDEDTYLTAWHEAGHTLATKLLTKDSVSTVTIVQSTSGAGGVTFMAPDEKNLPSKKYLRNKIKIDYAGRAAEEIYLGNSDDITTGASQDIKQATSVIKSYIGAYGMGNKGLIDIKQLTSQYDIVEEAGELSNVLYQETLDLLRENIDKLRSLAERLVEKETLYEDEINEILGINSEIEIKELKDTEISDENSVTAEV